MSIIPRRLLSCVSSWSCELSELGDKFYLPLSWSNSVVTLTHLLGGCTTASAEMM